MINHQASRYELKYLISEPIAGAVRERVRAYLQPDENGGQGSIGYRVQSLYFDSRSLTCYSQTMQGIKNRFKLRIRFYDDNPKSPVFLEVKRRVSNVILKKRAVVKRTAAEAIIRGNLPAPSMLVNNNSEQRDALNSFYELKEEVGAMPKIFVEYYREAFQCGGANHYRVTFDRLVRGSRYNPAQCLQMPERTRMAKIPGVILEMKYINEPASWMIDIARQFQLERTSVPKYVECVDVVEPAANLLTRIA